MGVTQFDELTQNSRWTVSPQRLTLQRYASADSGGTQRSGTVIMVNCKLMFQGMMRKLNVSSFAQVRAEALAIVRPFGVQRIVLVYDAEGHRGGERCCALEDEATFAEFVTVFKAAPAHKPRIYIRAPTVVVARAGEPSAAAAARHRFCE